MLASRLNVKCSKRCEYFVAMAIVFSPTRVVELAHRLVQDQGRSALQMAKAVSALPEDEARSIAISTLCELGFSLDEVR